ncbi:MAG: hypothetical protein K0Q43_1405 [Ramlibacter sp.]|jgi:hypothetical protein|nr:hypothetical protein [Ramlibacter sp.]
MSKFNPASGAYFGRSRLSEAIAEMSLTVAAAAFTAAIWLAVGSWALVPGGPAAAEVATSPAGARHVTLPTVLIVGRRDSPDSTPVTTTAQNTAANPITLR